MCKKRCLHLRRTDDVHVSSCVGLSEPVFIRTCAEKGLVALASRFSVVVVVPAFNERSSVGGLVRSVRRHLSRVVVVDDGSSDSTAKEARNAGAEVLSLPVNMGVGFATRLGVEHAIEQLGADVVVTLDADGQHCPGAIPFLLSGLSRGVDVVFAVRKDRGSMPVVKRFGNYFLSAATNALYGQSFSDTQTGFRAFTAEAYRKMELFANDYSFCSEFASEVARNGLKYSEVPIDSTYDSWTAVKGTDLAAGARIFVNSLFWRFSRWRSKP